MKNFMSFFLVFIILGMDLTNIAIAAAPGNNVAPEYKGPKAQQLIEGTELKIEKPMPISIHDPDNNLKEVQLNVNFGILSITGKDGVTVTGPNTHQLTLTLAPGGTQSDINETLKTLTYKKNKDIEAGEDKLIVNAKDDKNKEMAKETIPITIIQASAVSKVCDPNQTHTRAPGDWGKNWSAGPTVSYSLVQYNLADKKSSLNAKAAGAGISFRYYSSKDLAYFGEKVLGRPRSSSLGGNSSNEKTAENTGIGDIPSGCRAQTTDFTGGDKKIASWFSVAPTMYVFQDQNEDGLGVQIAVNFGFLNDIFSVGVGWNLSGGNAGEWFILAGPSFGFRF